jgi:ribosomal protein S18 acetylase RimI-like enzyme
MDEVELRPATQEDLDFLYHVLKATMREYVAQIWGWDEQWQQAHFRENFDPTRDRVIVLAGEDIGVLSTEERESETFVSKIYILPDHQRRGIGSYLMGRILAEASDRGVPVTLGVLKANPATAWYERLGFVEVGRSETHILMKATPPATLT